jgi:hypothetical protein
MVFVNIIEADLNSISDRMNADKADASNHLVCPSDTSDWLDPLVGSVVTRVSLINT